MTQDGEPKLPLKRSRKWVVLVPLALVAMIVGILLAALFPRTSHVPDSSPSSSPTSSGPQACTAADVLAESNPPLSVELRSGERVLDVALSTYPGLLVDGPEAPPILLEPGDKARSFVNWTNWCAGRLASLEMQVVLPDGSDPTFIVLESGSEPATTPRCDNLAAPSSLGVFAFAPLTN